MDLLAFACSKTAWWQYIATIVEEIMELKVAAVNLGKVTKQRNLFLCLVLVFGLSNLMLSFKLSTAKERIIMVPGIRAEMSITGNSVSESYLEESALLFLSCLLDLTPDIIEHKRDLVLKYTSHSDSKWITGIKEYFNSAIEQHRKFKLSTYFTPKNMSIDTKNMQVVAHGILNSSFGKEGYDSKQIGYLLEFELVGGHLKLKQFRAAGDNDAGEDQLKKTAQKTNNKKLW